MPLDHLPTPSLILDIDTMKANIERMAARCRLLGVSLRPHAKTPKSIPVVREMRAAGAQGFTVSTLREAEYLMDGGFADIFYAVPLDVEKVGRAAELLRKGAELSFMLDGMEAANLCARRATTEGVSLPIWIEIDVDHYRTGLDANSPEFDALVEFLTENPATSLRGIASYGGSSYICKTFAEVADLTERHRTALLRAADRVVSAGHPRPHLSFGSTPAVLHARTLDGIDEVRCGIYAFQDLFQSGIGACTKSDIALSVLATVISRNPELNRFTVDAGGLALSKDRSTQGYSFDAGYGLVCEAASGVLIEDLYVKAVSQELGMVTTMSGRPLPPGAFPIGSRIRILPNHADMTAAAYEHYFAINRHGVVADTWSRTNRW